MRGGGGAKWSIGTVEAALEAPIIACELPVLCCSETADGADGVPRTAAHAHAGGWAGLNRSEPTRGLVDEVCCRARCTSGCGANEIMTGKGPARL
jgi:hypothetical protein